MPTPPVPVPPPPAQIPVPSPPPVNLQPSSPPISKSNSDMLEPGERIVTIVHRHPIGIIAIYLEALAGLIAVVVLIKVLAPSFLDNLSGQAYTLMIAIAIIVVALVALVLLVATYIYRQSRLVVSNRSLIQVIQRGLFIRKISRLSMSNVQDVTAEHKGFLATIFGYGTLTIETAGEEDNFVFPWCPTPDIYAERILEARQSYAESEAGKEGL